MDQLFKPVQTLPGKASQFLPRHPSVPAERKLRSKELGCEYATKIVQKEEEKYLDSSTNDANLLNQDNRSIHGAYSEVDSTVAYGTSLGTSTEEPIADFYKKYEKNFNSQKVNHSLSIHNHKGLIVTTIEARTIVMIKGATGCGKTTQVPQFILQNARENNTPCKIVVTQPRRLAAVTVATRVAKEMDCPVGTLVGYQIGQDKKAGDDTKILYCTTGVLLQQLIRRRNLKEFSHYIIDEVHERSQEMDFLLLVIRKFLHTTDSRGAKLIVMSATIETTVFTEYLYIMHNRKKYFPPTIEVGDKENFPVSIYFLNDIAPKISEARTLLSDVQCKAEIVPACYITAVRLIQAFDSIDKKKESEGTNTQYKGSVLIFLPGLHEIEEMHRYLRKEMQNLEVKRDIWLIKPLHSSITADEQRSVLNPCTEEWQRKIILSTNIAESSITVRDTKYVIDFCLTKTLVTDRDTNFTSLQLEWASKNSLTQRAGRVGRVSDGRVYRLIQRDFYRDYLETDSAPEILRSPLDQLVLQAKLLNMGSPMEVLALAMSQPDLGSIQVAVAVLKEIAALRVTTTRGKSICYDECDGDITALGNVIAGLPMDVRLGKLIFFGQIFNVLEECIIMACAMSSKNLFSSPFQEYLRAYNSKLSWADSTCSDCVAFLNAYQMWRKCVSSNQFREHGLESRWAREEFLQLNVLREIAALQKEITDRLKRNEFFALPTDNNFDDKRKGPKENFWENKIEKAFFLKLAIAGAFYPSYFFRGQRNGHISEKDAVNTLGGNDPYSTVYLQGMPSNQPAVLYKKSIRDQFREISNRVNVIFDSGSKVYVNFGRSVTSFVRTAAKDRRMEMPGKIDLAVYRALKMRQVNSNIRIPMLNAIDAADRYEKYQQRKKKKSGTNKDVSHYIKDLIWPWRKDSELYSDVLEVSVVHIVSPHQFFIQDPRPAALKIYEDILNLANEGDVAKSCPVNADLPIGGIYYSAYTSDNVEALYRIRVISKYYRNNMFSYDIYFMDYGHTALDVPANKIFDIDPDERKRHFIDEVPELAVECSLAKIKPPGSGMECWSDSAVSRMEPYKYHRSIAKIYSVVDNVLFLKLLKPDTKDQLYTKESTMNHILISKGIAEKCEESYLSQLDHEERKRIMSTYNEDTITRNVNPSQLSTNRVFDEDLDSPSRQECKQEIVLKGPFSPLDMKIFSVTQASVSKNTMVERDSVNSILLDTNPSDFHERMLVAAFVGTNPAGDKLSLRHTTIMPNIPGLPALACLMFAPMVELRGTNKTNLTGALCGLGYNRATGKSLFPENDVEVNFDVVITHDDISLVNKIRFYFNLFMDPLSIPSDSDSVDRRRKLRERVNELFKKRYELQPLHFNPQAFQWGLIPISKLSEPTSSPDHKHPAQDLKYVFRFVWGIKLDKDMTSERESAIKNLKQIRELASGKSTMKSVECVICRITLDNCANAKLHLKNAQHKARLKCLGEDFDDNRSERSVSSRSVSSITNSYR